MFLSGIVWTLQWVDLLSLRPWKALTLILTARTLGLLLLLAATCSPVLFIHVILLRTSEAKPLQQGNYGSAAALMRTLGRLRTASDLLNAFMFIGSSMACGATFMAAFPFLRAENIQTFGDYVLPICPLKAKCLDIFL